MSRSLAGLLAALTLCLGVGIGVVAGILASPHVSDGAVAAAGPTPTPLATPVGSSAPGTASPAPSTSPAPTAASSYPPLPTPEPTPVLVADPLTGRMVAPAVAKRHVIAVMIDDQFAARPQSGLSSASVVWQAPAEGGIPRYMALFQEGSPKAVGPVRSSRLYFIGWASEWKAAYVHVGGSPQALALLHSADGKGRVVYDADAFRWEGTYLWRIKERNAPHNVYSDAAHLRAMAKRIGAGSVAYTSPWTFGPALPRDQRPKGGKLVVPYLANTITYDYDRGHNRYLRTVSVEGKQIDAASKARIAPTNVVVMVVSFGPLNDGTKKHRLEAQQVGSGTAWIATNGHTVKGTWKKTSFTAPTRFFGPDGKPVTLTVGQTFIQVVPRGTKITIRDGKVPPRPPRPAAGGHVDTGGQLPE